MANSDSNRKFMDDSLMSAVNLIVSWNKFKACKKEYKRMLPYDENVIVCLCWGFTAQSAQWGHVERGQFT